VTVLLLLALCVLALFALPARAFEDEETALVELETGLEEAAELAAATEAEAEVEEEGSPIRARAHARARAQREKFRRLRSKRTKKAKKAKKAKSNDALLKPLINDIKDTVAALSDSVDYLNRKPHCRSSSGRSSGCGGGKSRSGSSSNFCSSRPRASKSC